MQRLEDGWIYLDKSGVYEYIKNRPPMLFINDAYVRPGEAAYSIRCLLENEWYFPGHFPGNPMMPGIAQLESMFNTAALPIKLLEGYKSKTTNISQIQGTHFRRHIFPGDTIKVSVSVNKFRRGIAQISGSITREDEICCEAEFLLVVLDDVIEVKK